MRFWLVMGCILALPLMAQQQVVPEEFSNKQARLLKKVTESVSTPCCKNGIPVAYHDSGQAQYVNNLVIEAIRAGKSEAEIMAQMKDVRLGPKEEALIFTVPEQDLLGRLFWIAPVLLIVGLGLAIYFLLLKMPEWRARKQENESALIDKYGDFIRSQIGVGVGENHLKETT